MKAKEWATRQKDAAGELAAIAKAKEVLESGVKVFLQVRSQRVLKLTCTINYIGVCIGRFEKRNEIT